MLKANSEAHTSGSPSGEPCPKRSVLLTVAGEPMQESLLRTINALCEWLYPYAHHRVTKRTIILRTFVWIWFFRPEWLGNPTQVRLAKRLRVSKQSFNKVVSQLRDKFQFYVPGMRHEEARVKFAEHAKRHAESLAQKRRDAVAARGGRAMRGAWVLRPIPTPPGKESI